MISSRQSSHSKRTLHARQRMSQRGIRQLQLELIHLFGEDRYQKGGATLSTISSHTLAELRTAIDGLQDVTIVKNEWEQVVTAMHKHKRITRTEWAS